jgi:single-stranded-DNA-specific exonuclease
MSRSYTIAPLVPQEVAVTLGGIDPLKTQLLYTRGVRTPEDVRTFLEPDYDQHRHDPFLLPGMDVAVERILRTIRDGEQITVYADYDCDGIPGAVVLHDFFKDIGYEHVTVYIPHRHYEGFGLNERAVEKIADSGTTLIITVDCGSSDAAAIAAARARGVEVIVTDHHEVPQGELGAVALVNPKAGGTYPFEGLCGAGVAFKLVEALIARGDFTYPPGREKWLLDMVGLATVSDMVPLVGENRVFAKYGLTVLRKSRRPGLQHLFRVARANQRYLTEDDIGFTIGPRINAASRMDTPEDAFLMLAAREEGDAGARVSHLERLNNERKGLVASMVKELKKRVEDMVEVPPVLVVGSPEWRPALAGLAANNLAETYHRPAFVWGRDGNGIVKGSCRSEGATSVVALMNAVADIFLEHGGHHMSGGFSVRDEHVFAFPERVVGAYHALGGEAAVPNALVVDAELSLASVNDRLIALLGELAPFGVGNEKPVFAFPAVAPARVERFGKAKEHLKLTFVEDGRTLEAIAFFASPDSFTEVPDAGKTCTLIAHVEESYFMNRRQTRLRIVDVV